MNTKILLRRSENLTTAANVQLQYGEPLYTDDQYFTVGNAGESLVSQRNVIRFVPKSHADSQLYYSVNSAGKIVINIYDGTTLTPVTTLGSAAERDAVDSAVQGSNDLITSGAVQSIQSNLQNSIDSIQTAVQELQDGLSDLVGKSLDDTVTPSSENPVTGSAVYEFVTQMINDALNSYRPWTSDAEQTNKFYLNTSTGLQYHNGSQWATVPVGYT